MRSINRGVSNTTYTTYGDALEDLMDVIGDYCSYCEISLTNLGAVEHVIPQANGGPVVQWNNFLIACTYCNSSKGDRNPARAGYVWPDMHKTLPLFEYIACCVFVAQNLAGFNHQDVLSTIELMGLHKIPGEPRFNKNDRRWRKRFEAFVIAEDTASKYAQRRYDQDYIDLIIENATGRGFFTIWHLAFAAFPEVQQALINAFPGTDL